MKPTAFFLFLLGLILISIHTIAQNQPNKFNTRNRNGMMYFDLSALDWTQAFDSLHTIMQERYPYTEWKAIEWEQKWLFSYPKIVQAQSQGDTVKYSEALFEYLYSIPDGHVMLRGDVTAYRQAKQGGSYGMSMIPLTDGTIVANIVIEGGPAWIAGIRCGDEILYWKGTPIGVVPELEVYNNFGGFATNYATEEGRLIGRYEVLSRDSVGAIAEVIYKSRVSGVQKTVLLTAADDGYSTLLQAYFLTAPIPNFDSAVTWRILPEEIGYLKVIYEPGEETTLSGIRQTQPYLDVKAAITAFNQQGINKLIIDLRFNTGGNDLLGSAISGFFYNTPSFYEYITGTSDEQFAIIDSIITMPESPYFGGEIAIIVGPNCISTGEGIPMMIQRLPNGQVISFWGTNGSFGMVPNVVFMTDSLQYIIFPYARSLNHSQVIQLDSDSTLTGGVQPDIRIPLTVERVIKQWQEGKDVELEYAIGTLLDITEFPRQNEFKIYPNPADALFHIKYDLKKPISILITDVSGRLVKLAGHITSDQPIDVGNLTTGLYFVIIDDSQQYVVRKLLIQ